MRKELKALQEPVECQEMESLKSLVPTSLCGDCGAPDCIVLAYELCASAHFLFVRQIVPVLGKPSFRNMSFSWRAQEKSLIDFKP